MPTAIIQPPIKSLLKFGVLHRFANLWKIERTDNASFFFTDCDVPILFEGDVYIPSDSIATTASQQEEGLRAVNAELTGLISSDAITDSDLRAGRFDKAKVTHRLVDWRYPWAGAIKTFVFWFGSLEYDQDFWRTEVTGIAGRLTEDKGKTLTRTCLNTLGDGDCRVDLSAFDSRSGTITVVKEQRREFKSDLSAEFAENLLGVNNQWFKFGVLAFTSGFNNGLSFEIGKFIEPTPTAGSSTIRFFLRTPFDLVVNDAFTAIPGCDKRVGTCKTKFKAPAADGGVVNNIRNFGGFPFVPGSQRLLKTPGGKGGKLI